MNSTITAVIVFVCLGAFYGVMYFLNHKTPAPKGMEDLKADCEGCHDISCGNNPAHRN